MNQPLLVVLPYHNGDIELARKLIEWIAELGSCLPHSILFCADASTPRDKVLELMAIARPHFANTRTMLVTVPAPEDGKKVWPPNVMFLNAARQVQDQFKMDFLWLEPDAIPIYAGWLDDIAEEYAECPYRFMGSLIKQQGQEGLPPEYLNGVSVYPNDAFEVFDKIASVKDSSQAFDIGSAAAVVPKSLNTRLIQHYYGTKELPPVFVESRAPDAPKNHVTLEFVPKEAAIFHRSKDGKLIELLRARRNLIPTLPKTIIEVPVIATVQNTDRTISKAPPEIVYSEKELMGTSKIVVHESPVAPNEVTPEQSEQIRRGPGRPRKETVST